jgi:glyoxylase-like metal-dependent hydrolase (beta-lactamase superfamily II)
MRAVTRFSGGVGRTTASEDFAALISDVERKIFNRLPHETWVYPGHGVATTLRRERPHLRSGGSLRLVTCLLSSGRFR